MKRPEQENIRIKIKPMSVNDAWQGRRYKSDEYKAYAKELTYALRPMKIPEGNLFIHITWGFSNKGSDIDNPAKPFLDILQKKYRFNDSRIYRLLLDKQIVSKGSEFIEFEIKTIENILR